MTAFTFSVEQLRAAPPEVRRWVANEIARALGGVGGLPAGGPDAEPTPQEQPMTLAACTAPEALQVFELIANDVIVARLFFELAREHAFATNLPGLHALRMADLLHHVGLPDQNSLVGGLAAIDRAFRQVRGMSGGERGGDRAGSLFGFDDAGHVFVHEATQASIHRVWEELVHARAATEPAGEAGPRLEGFTPPHVGPSEDVAGHAAAPRHGGNPPL